MNGRLLLARHTLRCSQYGKIRSAELGISCHSVVASFFRTMSSPPSESTHSLSNMSGINVLSGARNVVVSGSVNIAETVCKSPFLSLIDAAHAYRCVSSADQLQLAFGP